MTLGQIAGLIAALAAVVLVALCAVPLLKLGGVLDEVRRTVRDVDESTVPILEELKGTVVITNGEISKLDQVIEDIHTISEHGTVVTGQAAERLRTSTTRTDPQSDHPRSTIPQLDIFRGALRCGLPRVRVGLGPGMS